jgi:predicted dehydrogenase
MKDVRIGVIGLGNMGSGHIANIEAGKITGMKLVAVCDINPKKLEKYEGKYKTFVKSEDLIRSGEVDAVMIETPHYSHTTIGIDALDNGIHVLVEKPISVHVADCQRLIAASKRHKKLVFAAMFNQRSDPHYIKLKEILDKKMLGEITRVNWIITDWFRSEWYYKTGDWRATWKGEGGGVLMNQCPHNLDLWQWIFGMPCAIYADCAYGKYHDIEVEDDVTAMAKYPNGATGVFITTTGEYPGTNRLEITGSKGKLVYERGRLTYTKLAVDEREFTFSSNQGFASIPCETCEIEVPAGHGEQHDGIFKNFTNHILFGEELLAPGCEGINGLSICNAMLLSSAKGKWVEIPNDGEEFWEWLQGMIKTSRLKDDAGVVFDTEGSYGNK